LTRCATPANSVRAEPAGPKATEGQPPLSETSKTGRPFDKLRANGNGKAPPRLCESLRLCVNQKSEPLHPEADFDYMESRIRYETAGEYGIDALKD
jgi:hypothetical protein